ncbi:hypothetical protein U8335_08070 [Roseiconus lacunae]|uniref:BatD family protein n=1 Tax=Roseiconus lacunae TaxID=2605694 RepID=UPI0030854A1F|nr:hypothetical protein U8335_08070 [Stieleria sp. HD01]
MMLQFEWRSLVMLFLMLSMHSLSPQCDVVLADVQRVVVEVRDPEVWVGQKASFFVKLRGQGPFVGAASFTLPEIPRAIILKVGNPVVSSEEIEDDSWFVQSHEFVLFSQQDGELQVSGIEVRFTDRDGYTGPERPHQEQVPELNFQIKRPEKSDPGSFLITTDSLKIEESWDPQPGKAEQGAVFYRTITQQAKQISGMALAPPSVTTPDGIKVHLGNPEVQDNTERGEFSGRRVDRLTYVLEQPGVMTLPALQYVWWNPKTEQYGSTTLPAVVFDVTAIPVDRDDINRSSNHERALWLFVGLVVVCAVVIVACYKRRHRLYACWVEAWQTVNPPKQRAARALRRACRRNDASAAASAWNQWRQLQPSGFRCPDELQSAVIDLQRRHYGPIHQDTKDRTVDDHPAWDGATLAEAFERSEVKANQLTSDRDLPPINPAAPAGR